MNTSQNIAVLGAGIMGLSTAYALSKRGHDITIYDPAGFPAHNASFIAGGMLAPFAEIEHMNASWIKAGLHGISLWQNFALTHDIEFAQRGSYLVAHKDDHYILERFKSHLPEQAGSYKCAEEIEPALKERFAAGLFIPSEAHLNPTKAMKALCETIDAAFITQSKNPEDLEQKFDLVIDARGLGANDEDLRGVKGEVLIVRNTEFTLSRPVRLMHPRYPLYVVPRAGNIFMIGATQIEAEEAPHITLRSAMELMSALYALSPTFGEAQILETLSGVRPSYPDNLPRLKRRNNIIQANGLFRHGWLLAPVLAESIGDQLDNAENLYISLFNGVQSETDNQRTGTQVRSAA
jgi:glycine oxidase